VIFGWWVGFFRVGYSAVDVGIEAFGLDNACGTLAKTDEPRFDALLLMNDEGFSGAGHADGDAHAFAKAMQR